MGIYDRDYYREEGGYRPFDSRVRACIVLVVVYIFVFFVQVATREGGPRGPFLPGPVTEILELKASKVLQGEIWRLVTYSFAHDPGNIFPIALNILFLIFFGRHVEDIYGWKEFLSFYILSGFLGGLAFFLVAVLSQHNGILLGPAASVTAVLFLYALHYPRRTVLLFFILPCPIWFVVAFHVLNDSLGLLSGQMHPAAFSAHVAAAAFAFLYHHYSFRVSRFLPSRPARGIKPKSRPQLQIFRDEATDDDSRVPVASTSAPATHDSHSLDEQLEAKLDQVLEKVKKEGQSSLTEEERAVLFRASEIYRKRRKLGGS